MYIHSRNKMSQTLDGPAEWAKLRRSMWNDMVQNIIRKKAALNFRMFLRRVEREARA
jgi:hypothetical protein